MVEFQVVLFFLFNMYITDMFNALYLYLNTNKSTPSIEQPHVHESPESLQESPRGLWESPGDTLEGGAKYAETLSDLIIQYAKGVHGIKEELVVAEKELQASPKDPCKQAVYKYKIQILTRQLTKLTKLDNLNGSRV